MRYQPKAAPRSAAVADRATEPALAADRAGEPAPAAEPNTGASAASAADWRRLSIAFFLCCAILAIAGRLSVALEVAPNALTACGLVALLAAGAVAAEARLRRGLASLWRRLIWTVEMLSAVLGVVAGAALAMNGVAAAEAGPLLAVAVLLPAAAAPLRWGVAVTAGIGLIAGYMSGAGLLEPPLPLAYPAATAAIVSLLSARARRRTGAAATPAKRPPAAAGSAPPASPAGVTLSVLEMATSFTSANEPAEMAARIAQGAVEQLQATGAVLLVWNPTANAYRIAAVRGQDVPGIRDILEVEVTPQSVPVLDPASAGRAITLPVLGFSEPVIRSLLRRWRANKIVGVQLRRNEKELGLLVAARGEQEPEFDDRDREVVSAVSMHAAAALAHAQSIAELEAANALKEEFMATMSHELRTPLNVIIGYTDLQLDEAFGELGDDHRSTLETVRGQAIQLLELIQATLDMSRLERGLVQVELTDVAIPQFLDGLNRQIPPSWRKPGVGLHWNVQTGLPPLRTDPGKLQMLLRNLVHNALKFTQNGLVSVSVSSDAVRRVVTFIVQDSGVGIRAEHLSDIFEMFRQGPEGRSTTGGVGLGLYIVKRLAELLGAEIEVSSAPGRGATFRIHMPFDGPLAART